MSWYQFSPLVLEFAVLLIGTFCLLYESFANDRDKSFVAWTAIVGLGFVFLLTFFTGQPKPDAVYLRFYQVDALGMFFKRFALLTTILVLIMSLEYREVVKRYIFGTENTDAGLGEFYALPVFTCAGLMWMSSAVDFALIFVSLELVTISFYVLVSYLRRSIGSLEAGVKYLVLGALSTGFLVYGITWIFGVTGETNLGAIAERMQTLGGYRVPLLFGIMLVLVGLGFKIAAAPFQIWVPDVYQGAPTPITAFLSVGSKAAGFIVLIRVMEAFVSVPEIRDRVLAAVAVIAGLTLIYGNLAAMPQSNLKRLLAYSSIAHAGYLLLAVVSIAAPHSGEAIVFYLAGYLLMTLLAFLIIVVVSGVTGGDDISHFNGLNKRAPGLAFGMLVAMLSLAGIPLTAGFFGKFFVFAAAMQQQHYVLVAIGVITVGAGFYYYLKVVRAMYWLEPADPARITTTPLAKTTIGVLAALIFFLGVYPQPVLDMLKERGGGTSTVALK